MRAAIVLVTVLGCHTPPPGPTIAAHEPAGPAIPIRLGDCAPSTTSWVAGPKPLPFTADDLEGRTVPPPPERDSYYDAPLTELVVPVAVEPGFLAIADGPSRRRGPQPTTKLGDVVVDGPLDRAIVRRYIKRNLARLDYCYQKQLLATPEIEGVVNARLQIAGKDGKVVGHTTTGFDDDVTACIDGVIAAIEFPTPKGGDATARLTLEFDNGRLSAAPQRAEHPRRLPFRGRPLTDDELAVYTPGAESPLATIQPQLAACLAHAAQPYGVAVVELGTPRVLGLDAPTAACIARATASLPKSQRCSLAYGTMPSSALPTMAVGDDPEKLAVPPAATGGGELASHLPVVVTPEDASPMRVVYAAASFAFHEGRDVLLARKHGAAWKLLDAIELPSVPVPLDTGGYWTRVKLLGSSSQPMHPDVVSIHLTAEAPVDVVAKLRKRDAVAWEIAADPEVRWGDVAAAIEAAQAAGFTSWKLTDVAGLAAKSDDDDEEDAESEGDD